MHRTSISGLWTVVFLGQDGRDVTKVTIQLTPGTIGAYIIKALEGYGDPSSVTEADYHVAKISTVDKVVKVRPRASLFAKLGISEFPV